jgi:hypothetical protein
MKHQWIAAALMVACFDAGHGLSAMISQVSPSRPKTIKVTGFINACYKPNKWQVWITAVPPNNFESPTFVVGPNGRFTFTLDTDKVKPGDFWLRVGYTRRGAGSYRFTIKSEDVNLGEIGNCDV